jgi:hypothetical protein
MRKCQEKRKVARFKLFCEANGLKCAVASQIAVRQKSAGKQVCLFTISNKT